MTTSIHTNDESQALENAHKERTQKLVKMVLIPVGVLFYIAHFRMEVAVITATLLGLGAGALNAYITGKTGKWRNTNFYLRADLVDAIRWLANLLIVNAYILCIYQPSAAITAGIWTVFLIAAQLDLHRSSYRRIVLGAGWTMGSYLLLVIPAEPLPLAHFGYIAFIMGVIPTIFEYLEVKWILAAKESADAKKFEAEIRFRAQILERDAQLGMQSRMIVHELSNLIFILDLSMQRETLNRATLERSIHFIKRINRLVLEDLRQDALLGKTKIKNVIEDSKLLLAKSIQSFGIQLHFEFIGNSEDCEFEEYAGTLFLILRNLAKNAADAIQEKVSRTTDEHIYIRVKAVGRLLQVSVQDTGTGMDFQRLQSVLSGEAKSSKEKGHGIGMKFVIEQCKRNKFEIKGESELGLGTTFIVDIALHQEQYKKIA